MIARFRAWLRDLLDGGWDDYDGPTYEDGCTCSPAAIGPRGSTCPRCGGGVVYLSEHPTDTARREDRPSCEIDASCESGDHTYSWPCVYGPGMEPTP